MVPPVMVESWLSGLECVTQGEGTDSLYRTNWNLPESDDLLYQQSVSTVPEQYPTILGLLERPAPEEVLPSFGSWPNNNGIDHLFMDYCSWDVPPVTA
jgi:hypothetical protein